MSTRRAEGVWDVHAILQAQTNFPLIIHLWIRFKLGAVYASHPSTAMSNGDPEALFKLPYCHALTSKWEMKFAFIRGGKLALMGTPQGPGYFKTIQAPFRPKNNNRGRYQWVLGLIEAKIRLSRAIKATLRVPHSESQSPLDRPAAFVMPPREATLEPGVHSFLYE